MLRHLRFHLRGQGKPLLPLWLLALFLASCQWVPPMNTQNPRSGLQKASGPGNFSLLSADTPQMGQMITLPSQVHKSPLQALEEPPKGKHFRLHLSTKASGQGKSTSIHMPEQGAFELVIQSGPQFKVLDANASDGQAVVQMPASNYQALLKLHGKHTRTQKRSLQLEDTLYYLSHELQRSTQGKGSFQILSQGKAKKLELKPLCSSDPDHYRLWRVHNPNSEELEYSWQVEGSQQSGTEVAPPGDSVLETEAENGVNKLLLDIDQKRQDSGINKGLYCDPEEAERSLWWQVGSRTLPVPTAWKSSDGEKYVLRLNNQGVTDLTFRWYKTPNQAVALPPGTAEIGPAGGTVELPGVAKLEIPAGALSNQQIVKLSQEQTVADRSVFPKTDPNRPIESQWFERMDYMSPVVKIEPLGLKLNKAASLTLPGKDEDRLSNQYSNFVFFILQTQDVNADNYHDFIADMDMLSYMHNRPLTIRDPIIVQEFGYIAKMKFHRFDVGPEESNFRIQSEQTRACDDALLNYSVIIQTDQVISSHFDMSIPRYDRHLISDEQVCKVMNTFERVYEVLTNPSEPDGPQNKFTLHPSLEKKIKISLQDKVRTAPDTEITGGHVLKCPKGSSICQNRLLVSICPNVDLNTTSCSLNEQRILETVSHELFHYFQKGYVINANYDYPNDNLRWHESWFLEGTASWFSQKFAETQAVKLGFNSFKVEDMAATAHLAYESKRAVATPFLEQIQDQRKYAYHGFFSLFNEQIVYDSVRNFVEDYGKNAQFDIDRSTLSLSKSLKAHDESKDIAHFYAQYGKNALLMSNILPVDKFKYTSKNSDHFHVEIVKPEPWNQITSGTHNQTNPAKFEIEIDSTQTKYYQLLPHASALDGSQRLNTYIESVEPEEINGIKVRDYLDVHVTGIDNSDGIAVDLEDDFSFRRHNIGEPLSLMSPETNYHATLDNFGPNNLSKSAILTISNGLWQILPSKIPAGHPPIKINIAAYIESKRFRSVDPDLIKAQKATQVLVQGTELESINQVIIQSTSHPYTVYTAQATFNTDSNDLSVSVPGLTAGNYKMAGLLQSGAQCYIPTLHPPVGSSPPSGTPPSGPPASGPPPSGAPPSVPPNQDICKLTNALSLGVTNPPPVSNLIKARRYFVINMAILNNGVLMAFRKGENKPFYMRFASGDVGSMPTAQVINHAQTNFADYIQTNSNIQQIVQYDLRPWPPGAGMNFNDSNSPLFDLEELHGDITVKVFPWSPTGISMAAVFQIISFARVNPHPDPSRGSFLDLSWRWDGSSQEIFQESRTFEFFLPEFFKNEGWSEVYFDLIEQYNIDPSSVY